MNKIQLVDEIVPCPFCGEIPTLHKSHSKYAILHVCFAMRSIIGYGKKNEVIEQWSTRPLEQQIRAEALEEAAKIIENIKYHPDDSPYWEVGEKFANEIRARINNE